jgi:hypothetical protein
MDNESSQTSQQDVQHYCPTCGNEAEPGSSFCGECGRPLRGSFDQKADGAAHSPVTEPPGADAGAAANPDAIRDQPSQTENGNSGEKRDTTKRSVKWPLVVAGGLMAALVAVAIVIGVTSHGSSASTSSLVTSHWSSPSPATTPSTTAPSSSSRQVLAPATVPPVVDECTQQLTFGADGNAGPISCSNGDLNVLAWQNLAAGHPPVMSLGRYATPGQVQDAICGQSNSTLPITRSAYAISALYYGWHFGVDPTSALTDGGCTSGNSSNSGSGGATVPTTTAPTPPTTASLPRFSIPPGPGNVTAGYSGRYPTTIAFTGDSQNIVTGISWSSWGPDQAVGNGTWTYNDCVPDCASGSTTPYPATITLSNPANGMYTTLTEVTSGPNGSTQSYTYGTSWPVGAQ